MIIEEMTTWSTDEVLAHVLLSLPDGWKFDYTTVDRLTAGHIYDDDGVEQWASEEPLPDVRMVFLDAYGWLQTRNATVRHPVWSRRGEIDRSMIAGRFGIQVDEPDPEHLDPTVIDEELRKKLT